MTAIIRDKKDQLISNVVCGTVGAKMARDGQVQVIRRLLYEKADNILVASNAYGKRAVLYAFVRLTEKVIIQIIPSENGAKDQAQVISAEVYGSRPVVATSGLLATTNFFDKMRAGKYTHILVTPELAACPKFTEELTRDPEFEKKLVLLTVHELHLVNKWKEYHMNGVFLDGLRCALPSVPWYACTAAFDLGSQEVVRKIPGFDFQHTNYVRIPLHRPGISDVLFPLHFNDDFACLNFLLAGTKPTEIRHIAKTVVHVADMAQLHKGRRSPCLFAEERDFSKPQAKRVIQMYDDDHLRDEEKETLPRDLAKTSDCRVVVPTVSLSAGWNLSDIIRVVHWGFPMDGNEISIGDWWRRNGVVMRDMDRAKALGYESGNVNTFATYDKSEEMQRLTEKCLASFPAGRNQSNVNTARPSTPRAVSTTHEDQHNASKALLFGETDSEESDCGSVASTSYDSSPSSMSTMSSLGRFQLDDGHEEEEENDYGERPAEGSLAWFAWMNISDYCWEKASEMDNLPADLTSHEFDYEGSRFYMDLPIQYAIGKAYSRAIVNGQDVPFSDEWSLLDQVPAIEDWEFWYSSRHVKGLIEFCHKTVTRVYESWESGRLP